jgi:hypothetical protein
MPKGLARLLEQHRGHQRALEVWHAMHDNLPRPVDPSVGGLTICSVAFRAKWCLDLNHQLTRRLNPDVPRPEWLLFDNNIEPQEMMDPADPRFTVARPAQRDLEMGYEHALGITAIMGRVRTRFLLILDPDCFLVMPDWIRRVPEYMLEHELGFFGTPINPKRHNSYRYFPYMVCMFIDLARVSMQDLCFLPSVWNFRTNVTYRMRRAVAEVPKVGALFRWLLTEQWLTNGWRIRARFGSGGDVKFECAQPVWDVNKTLAQQGTVKRAIHRLTPGSVSPIPKQPDYCAPLGFASMGAPDVAARGWEEFVWRGEPFAFHVGSVHSRTAGDYYTPLEATAEAFARRAAAGGEAARAIVDVGAH